MRSLFILAGLFWANTILMASSNYYGLLPFRGEDVYTRITVDDDATVSISYPLHPLLPKGTMEANPFEYAERAFPILDNTASITFLRKHRKQWIIRYVSPAGSSEVPFYREVEGPDPDQFETYSGTYEDADGRVLWVRTMRSRLRVVSPYSQEVLTLRPIGEGAFWASTGERLRWEGDHIHWTSNEGSTRQLTKSDRFTEEEVWVVSGADSLYGKLFVPSGEGPFPGCVVLQGGGSAGLANYELEAKFFAMNGVATLLCNKAGEGQSKGPGQFWRQTFREKTGEYLNLFRFLARQPGVDPQRVGVHGVSEGGRLALMMAQAEPEVAFVMAGAAPVMTMREGQLYAMDHYHRDLNIDEQTNLGIQQVWADYYQGIIDEDIDTTIIERANALREVHQRVFLPPNSTRIPASPRAEDLLNASVVDDLPRVQCPVLLQYGEVDHRVNPYKSLEAIEQKLPGDTPRRTVLYPRAGHSFMTPEFQISPGYLHDKINWLRSVEVLN